MTGNKADQFKFVYDQFEHKVYRLCLGFVGNASDADKLFRYIFIKVWKNLDALKEERTISTWIYKIASNTALLFVSRRSKHRKTAHRRISLLSDNISSLKERDRLLLSMKLDEVPNHNIAEVLGMSNLVVETYIHKIFKDLNEMSNTEWDLHTIRQQWMAVRSEEFNGEDFIHEMDQAGKIDRYQYMILAGIGLFAVFMMGTFLTWTWYNITSVSLILIAMLSIFIPLYKFRFQAIYIYLDLSNLEFVKHVLHIFRQKLRIPHLYMLIFIVLFTVGLNVAFLGAYADSTLMVKILLHSSTIGILLILLSVRKSGIQLYNKQFNPIIKRLEHIEMQFLGKHVS